MAEADQIFDRRLRPFLDRARIDCDRLFDYPCPKQWGELQIQADPGVRFCTECNREVHLAYSEPQLRALAKARACVAVVRPEELPDPEQVPPEEQPVMMVGMIASEF